MEPNELDPIVVIPESGGNTDQACQVFFYGDYHFCGYTGDGLVQCCLGGLN